MQLTSFTGQLPRFILPFNLAQSRKMEVDCGYPGEIISAYDNKGCYHDTSKHSKKRKFLSEVNEQLSSPAPKYICCETLIEHGPFSKESQQAKVFYTHVRKEKTSLEDMGADSAKGSSITFEDSLSRCSHMKPDKSDSYYFPSLSHSSSVTAVRRNADSYSDSTTNVGRECIMAPHQDIEFDGNGNGEDEVDEFGHCLGYLVSACDVDSKKQIDEELDDLLCMDVGYQVSQLSTHKPTIDREFEEYFSTLML